MSVAFKELAMAYDKIVWNGENYNKNSAMQYTFAAKAIASIEIKTNAKILDLGCGNGALSMHMSNIVAFGSVTGSDCDQSQIDFANKTYAPLQHNLKFELSFVQDVNYSNEFDLVTSFCMLHWVPDIRVALRNIYNAVKSGGSILLFIPVAHNSPLYDHLFETMADEKWKSYFTTLKPQDKPDQLKESHLEEVCNSLGFHNVSVISEVMPYSFPTRDDYAAWLNALPFKNVLPFELQSEFVNDHASKAMTLDGCSICQCNFITIKAVK